MITAAKRLLSQNIMENIAMLKMLETYGEQISCHIRKDADRWAVKLHLPVLASPFDKMTYPEAETVLFLTGSDVQIVRLLIDELPVESVPFIFKSQREEYRRCMESRFQMEKKLSFYSYSRTKPIYSAEASGVIEEQRFNECTADLWSKTGYAISELRQMFERGARSFTLYENGEAASACLIFPNYDHVWEIGALYTLEASRGKGYAKKVVTSALNRLLTMRCIPRYQVEDHNTASIRLTESLGFSRVVTMDHLLYRG